jgi:hypothetical protein
MTSFYNSSLTARLNNLSDKQETSVEVRQAPFKGISLDVPEDNSPDKDK